MNPKASETKATLTRRGFLKSAAAGAGAALVGPHVVSAAAIKTDTINIALIGAGAQGRVLAVTNCVKIPGVRFKAVCEIWPFYRSYAARALKAYKQPVNEYEDYREMLDKEKDLDAVLVATPDWMHAEHTIACLKAGKHVYCEKEMSNTLDGAKAMVQAAKAAGKLLQIGHQRRSNPRYYMALDYIDKKKALGRITHVMGQWNRSTYLKKEPPERDQIDKAALAKYGYDSIEHLANWRWYKKYSGGPMADLGSHQVDVFHWFLHALPKGVLAAGGLDNYKGIEWYDNVQALYEWDYTWEGETRTARGFYQLCSTTSHGGFTETFMGTEGSMIISEQEGKGGIRREQNAPEADWEKELQKAMEKAGLLKAKVETKPAEEKAEDKAASKDEIKVGHSIPAEGRYYPPLPPLSVPEGTPPTEHGPHLVNFFDSIRGKAKLNCPGEVGYETAVSILRVAEAIETGKKVVFKPEEFKV